MAAVIAHEYPRTWVKILAYTTATAVAIRRYTAGNISYRMWR
jgi:hypothetical protein